MNRRTLLLSPLALSLAPGTWAQESKSTKLALVIGCKNYLFGKPLGNTLNDARDMKAALEALGYEVLYLEDPSLKKLTEQLAEFSKKAKAATERVVYYSGHGVQVNGVNYLLPVTFQAKEMAELPDQALGLSQLMGALPESGINIVILDACRDNPFSKSFRSTGGSNVLAGLGNQERPTGTLIAYATKPGDVASDASPNGRNGLYTGELLKHLKTPGLTVEQVFKRTRAGVIAASNKQQQPWDESSLVNDFSFTMSSPPTAVSKGKVVVSAKVREKYPALAAYLGAMRPIPAGTFMMGSDAAEVERGYQGMKIIFSKTPRSWFEAEYPPHPVTLTAFSLGKTPVTVAMWREYANETLVGRMPETPIGGWLEDHPIVNVSWFDCIDYCKWASEVSGVSLGLPTEAQWEYAAKGGGSSRYPWGDVFDRSKCIHSIGKGKKRDRTASVNRKDSLYVNGYGLLDMSGNIFNWCSDWYTNKYPSAAQVDPIGASSGSMVELPFGAPSGPMRVQRGGGFDVDNESSFRCANRSGTFPSTTSTNLGFRLCVQ